MKRLLSSLALAVLVFGIWYAWNYRRSPYLQWKSLTHQRLSNVRLETPNENEISAFVGDGTVVKAVLLEATARSLEQLMQGIQFKLDSIYQDYQVPYPGQVSEKVSCPIEFRPKPLPDQDNESVAKKGLWMYANDRLTIGACDQSNVFFKAINLILNCKKSGNIFEIKVFIPSNLADDQQLMDIYQGFSCD